MGEETLVQLVQSFDFSKLLNLSKEKLEALLGKDFAMMQGYSQNNPHHCYDLLEHTLRTVAALNCDDLSESESIELKIAALYHDIGKPAVAFEKNGRTVFYNHAIKSRKIAETQLGKHNLEEYSLGRILFYIEHHDDFISFKLKADVKDNKNPFVRPITLETVYKKILETQEDCRNRACYVPMIRDYLRLMRLCIADAKAQNSKVVQDGLLIDSFERKLARLNAISEHIRVIETAETQICDLHTHSVFSDGTDTPSQLVKKAAAKGLRAVALTDHNTIGGLDQFIEAAKKFSIAAVPGIEFSTEFNGRELHILGLFINKNQYKRVTCYLEKFRLAKEESNRSLIKKLQEIGYDVTYEELKAFATNDNINRAVIGQYLVNKGIIISVKEGFKSLLSKNSGYYIPPQRPSTIDTIKFIKSIGALSVLAHPLLNLTVDELKAFLPSAVEAGIDAIETYYSLFVEEQQRTLLQIANENGILTSGGSDYHGNVKPHISLGSGTGSLFVPLSTYLKLVQKLQP